MNKKLIWIIPLFLLATVFLVNGASTPSCTFSASSSNATGQVTNVTIMFGITDPGKVNFTNVTFAISPPIAGNNSIFYDSTQTTSNQSTPYFTISNVPTYYYTITATARYMNGTLGIYNDNLTTMSSTCSGTFDINPNEGFVGPTVEITTTGEPADNTILYVIIGFVVLLGGYFLLNKK